MRTTASLTTAPSLYVVVTYTSNQIDERTGLPFRWHNILRRDGLSEHLSELMPGVRREVEDAPAQLDSQNDDE